MTPTERRPYQQEGAPSDQCEVTDHDRPPPGSHCPACRTSETACDQKHAVTGQPCCGGCPHGTPGAGPTGRQAHRAARSDAAADAAYLSHFQARVVQDALQEATAAYWERRAAAFDWAAPRATDFAGRASAEDLAAAASRCSEKAAACRARAALARMTSG